MDWEATLNQAASIEAVLTERGLLTDAALERVRRLEAESGERLDRIAAKLGLISDRDLADAYAVLVGERVLTPAEFPIEPIEPERLRAVFLKAARLLPIAASDETIVIGMADPLDDAAARAVAFAVGRRVQRRVAIPAELDAAHERLYGEARSGLDPIYDAADGDSVDRESDLERLKDLASEAPVIRLVNALIARAVEIAASDIHLESAENELRVRYRVDGVLREMESPPARLRNAIVSRVKIMAKLNIAERRLPQDGRIRLAVRGKEIDFRVSTIPAIHGESVVLRILDRGSLALDFEALGFDDTQLPSFIESLTRPHGIVLVSGPTGSGKTTTLYAALTRLNSPDNKILTAENPVEYMLPGINQVQVNPEIGLTFATALQSFLRQDPDIMMIGEIRNLETARIAVQAALTGHLVLSTVHTNDAGSAMTRLLDMGIENYLLNSTVNAVLAQRLVRRLCPSCREPYPAPPEIVRDLDLAALAPHGPFVLHRERGCAACNGLGFSGRTMILELMVMNDELRSLVLRRAEAREVQAAAIEGGMQTMYTHGIRKALAGITTIEEIFRVTREM